MGGDSKSAVSIATGDRKLTMKMTYLKIEKSLFNPAMNTFTSVKVETPLEGTVRFAGTSGVMDIPLTAEDIENIQQLLMKKTKDLASEA